MPYLIAVSLLWAFSFGLIKGRLVGLDSSFVAAARLAFAFLVFAPFFRPRGLTLRLGIQLAALGAVQFGAMYVAYNESFRHLAAHEVALLTLTTPLFVTLLADALERRFRPAALGAAALAVAGTALVVFSGAPLAPTLIGVALLQFSNAAFAFGQVWYRRIRQQSPALEDRAIFALPCLGGFALAAALCVGRAEVSLGAVTGAQWLTLAYLGVLASGLGFFLWNVGVTRVSAGTAAVMNNAKIPLGVACSLLFFGETADPLRVIASLGLLGAAVWLAERPAART